jgi:hypothetical protein
MYPAFATTTSIGPTSFAALANAFFSASSSVTSALKNRIFAPPLFFSSAAASRRTFSRRPVIIIAAAPAWLKAEAMCLPRPLPPPVTRTTLPAAELEGAVGEMAG